MTYTLPSLEPCSHSWKREISRPPKGWFVPTFVMVAICWLVTPVSAQQASQPSVKGADKQDSVRIYGRVISYENKPLDDARVLIYTPKGLVIGGAMTDSSGAYEILLATWPKKGSLIEVAKLGSRKRVKGILPDDLAHTESNQGTLIFRKRDLMVRLISFSTAEQRSGLELDIYQTWSGATYRPNGRFFIRR